MLLETLSISQQVWCQGWNARVELATTALLGGRRWRRAGASLLCLPDPLLNQKVYGGFGTPAVGIQKRQNKIRWGRKGADEALEIGEAECQCCPTTNPPPWTPAHPHPSPCSQISICGSNDPASGPCGQSRGRPVIKMKWAADPMVPFQESGTLTTRPLSHWSASSERKKFLSSREACSLLHCSISEQMSLWKRKTCFWTPLFVWLPAVLVLLLAVG